MVKVNGKLLSIDGQTIGEYLNHSNFDLTRIAIELNGEFIPKVKFSEIFLKDGDTLEVVSFVGGG